MIKFPQGSTGYFVIELFDGTTPLDIPEGAELTYTVSTLIGKQLMFRATTVDGSIAHVDTGIYVCFLSAEVSKKLTQPDNYAELALFMADKSMVNIGCNNVDIQVIPNTINRAL